MIKLEDGYIVQHSTMQTIIISYHVYGVHAPVSAHTLTWSLIHQSGLTVIQALQTSAHTDIGPSNVCVLHWCMTTGCQPNVSVPDMDKHSSSLARLAEIFFDTGRNVFKRLPLLCADISRKSRKLRKFHTYFCSKITNLQYWGKIVPKSTISWPNQQTTDRLASQECSINDEKNRKIAPSCDSYWPTLSHVLYYMHCMYSNAFYPLYSMHLVS